MNVIEAKPDRRKFGWLAFLLGNGLLPALLGGVAVVSVLPINVAAFAVWLALLAISVQEHLRQQRSGLAITLSTTQVAVIVAIVTAAHLAPGKTTDRFLDRTITIPRSRMTLAELEGDTDGPRPEWCPFSVWISVPDDEKTKVIAFPETTVTLRQFVGAIESQSTLRHRFAHCGNGWTILRGGDCSFGLHVRHPPDRPY
jgi:hypothetical protein